MHSTTAYLSLKMAASIGFFTLRDIDTFLRELGCPVPALDPASGGRQQHRAEAGIEEIKVTPIAYSNKVKV